MADGIPDNIGVFNTNPVVYQVATTLNYSWPNAAAVLAPGGAPVGVFPGPAGGIITYGAGAAAFGGPAQFAINVGPGGGTYGIPTVAGMVPIATVFINVGGGTPVPRHADRLRGGVEPVRIRRTGSAAHSGGHVHHVPERRERLPYHQLPGRGRWLPDVVCDGQRQDPAQWGHDRLERRAAGVPMGFPTNMATATEGFPFATALVTISAMGAVPPEVFFAEGNDARAANGAGNISLVAGALSDRNALGSQCEPRVGHPPGADGGSGCCGCARGAGAVPQPAAAALALVAREIALLDELGRVDADRPAPVYPSFRSTGAIPHRTRAGCRVDRLRCDRRLRSGVEGFRSSSGRSGPSTPRFPVRERWRLRATPSQPVGGWSVGRPRDPFRGRSRRVARVPEAQVRAADRRSVPDLRRRR